jgi:hypothetical protein
VDSVVQVLEGLAVVEGGDGFVTLATQRRRGPAPAFRRRQPGTAASPSAVVVLVRHGESLAQARDRSTTKRTDPSLRDCGLSRVGVQQAQALRGKLAGLSLAPEPELLLCSPLKRAIQTALHAFPDSRRIVVHPGLTERGGRIPENQPCARAELEADTELMGLQGSGSLDFSLLPSGWPSASETPHTGAERALLDFLGRREERYIVAVTHHNLSQKLLGWRTRRVENCDPMPCLLMAGRLELLAATATAAHDGAETTHQRCQPPLPHRPVSISLVAGFGASKGQVQAGVLVKPRRKEILRVAANKLRLSKKALRGAVLYRQARAGGSLVQSLISGADDLSAEVTQGCTIVIAPTDVSTTPVPPQLLPAPSSSAAAAAAAVTHQDQHQQCLSLARQRSDEERRRSSRAVAERLAADTESAAIGAELARTTSAISIASASSASSSLASKQNGELPEFEPEPMAVLAQAPELATETSSSRWRGNSDPRTQEKQTRIRELVSQSLWPAKGVHPARRRDARALFETLLHLSKGRGTREPAPVRHRQEGELHMFHYSQKIQNTGQWTPELLLARGIVLRRHDRTKETSLVATPWPKFFNLHEDGIGLAELAAEATSEGGCISIVTKIDGSLGLLFHDGQHWRVVTKGSFCSEQGRWATQWMHRHIDTSALTVGTTYLVEIVIRSGPIVVPYPFSKLVLLSAFCENGRELSRAQLLEVVEASRPKLRAAPDCKTLAPEEEVGTQAHPRERRLEPQLLPSQAAPNPGKSKKKHKKLLPSERRALKQQARQARANAQARARVQDSSHRCVSNITGSTINAAAALALDATPIGDPAEQLDARYGIVGVGMPGMALAAEHCYESLDAMLADVRRQDGQAREGVVAHFVFPDGASHRVKIKADDYLHAHRHRTSTHGFSSKRMLDAIQRDPTGATDPIEKMRNGIPEEFLAEFDGVLARVSAACDAALVDIAAQRELARVEHVNKKRTVAIYVRKNSSWGDGTPISLAFKKCWFAPFIPWADGCSTAHTTVPTAPGAWRRFTGASRKTLLSYVLPLLAQ